MRPTLIFVFALVLSGSGCAPGAHVAINYAGHAESWDEIAIEGSISRKDCVLRFKREGHTLAVASIFRDRANLQAELAMEREGEVQSA